MRIHSDGFPAKAQRAGQNSFMHSGRANSLKMDVQSPCKKTSGTLAQAQGTQGAGGLKGLEALCLRLDGSGFCQLLGLIGCNSGLFGDLVSRLRGILIGSTTLNKFRLRATWARAMVVCSCRRTWLDKAGVPPSSLVLTEDARLKLQARYSQIPAGCSRELLVSGPS